MIDLRTRWAAVGAAVAVTLGAGSIGIATATSPDGATAYQPITPCRIADTRSAAEFNVGDRDTPIGTDETHTITAHGANGDCTDIPTDTTGLQLNVTAVGATLATFITIWGDGDRPNASNLNPTPGQPPTPNAVTTGLTPGGAFHVYNAHGTVDVVIDIVGIYTDHHHDDRYYTRAETDAAFLDGAELAARFYTKTEIDDTFFDRPELEDLFYKKTEIDDLLYSDPVVVPAAAFTHAETNWHLLPGSILHSGVYDCATAPLSLPTGVDVSRMRVTWQGGHGDVDVFVASQSLASGPPNDPAIRAIFELPPILQPRERQLRAPVSRISVVPDFAYRLQVCTDADVELTAVELILTPTPKT